MGFIYKISNIETNDFYIGMTEKSLEERFVKHKSCSKKPKSHLHKAMKKYGHDKFLIEIVEECENILLSKKEIFYIETLNPSYNEAKGGIGGDRSYTKNFKNAMNKRKELGLAAGSNNSMYGVGGMKGKIHTDISKIKQSRSRKKYWINLTNEEKENRSKNMKGNKNPMFGKIPTNSVKIFYNGKIYNSIKSASIEANKSIYFIKKYGEIIE